MTLATACPKPTKRSESEQRVTKLVKAWKRVDRWRAKAIEKAKGKPRTKVKERNEKRIARRAANYRKVLASPFHRELRYRAYLRSEGVCECPQCVQWRATIAKGLCEITNEQRDEALLAVTLIPVWFTKSGGAPWRRFRSDHGEVHHTGNYKYFGQENPEEIKHVLWVWKRCHERIESQHHTRRRFLKGK